MRVGLELITRNWTLKLAALGLAILLWTLTRAESPTRRVTVRNVPVDASVRDPDWSLAAPPEPASVTVSFSGPARDLLALIEEQPRIVIPVEEVTDTAEVRHLQPGWIRLRGSPGEARVEEIRPSTVQLRFERVATRLLPVALRTRGRLPAGFEFTGPIVAEPPAVRVSGPERLVVGLDSLPIRPLEISDVRDTTALRVPVDTTGMPELLVAPEGVDVVAPVAPLADTASADTAAPGAAPDAALRDGGVRGPR